MLPAVVDDHLIQPVFFAGPYFSSTGHLKIPPNMKYRYDTMIIGCDHGTTDAILRFHGCCGRALYSILFRVYFAVLVLVMRYLTIVFCILLWSILHKIDFFVSSKMVGTICKITVTHFDDTLLHFCGHEVVWCQTILTANTAFFRF